MCYPKARQREREGKRGGLSEGEGGRVREAKGGRAGQKRDEESLHLTDSLG